MIDQFKIARAAGMAIPDEELLADLRVAAKKLGKTTIGQKEYREIGSHSDKTMSTHFGSWNKALEAAGLDVSRTVNLSDEQLFENILTLWQHYGRQPSKRELAKPPSTISESPYSRRFGSWWKSLEAFAEFANGRDVDAPTEIVKSSQGNTRRDPSLRLRWQVLQRDRFTCKGCGASPAINPGVELHVDHIKPWSKDGKTVLENLQALCANCNLGKSNL